MAKKPENQVARNAPFGNDFSVSVDKIRGSRRLFDQQPPSVHLFSQTVVKESEQLTQPRNPAPTMSAMLSEELVANPALVDHKNSTDVISELNGPSVPDSLYLNNDRLTKAEEEIVIRDCLRLFGTMAEGRLQLLLDELRDYDPCQFGIVDSAIFSRLLLERLKPTVLQLTTAQKLILLFAVNAKKPRHVRYKALVDYLTKVQDLSRQIGSSSMGAHDECVYVERFKNHQGPCTKHGDANLLKEIQTALRQHGISAEELDNLKSTLASVSRQWAGLLTEKQMIDLMRPTVWLTTLQGVLSKLLTRCELQGDLRYDSCTFVMFLEKAYDDLIANTKRDACSGPSPEKTAPKTKVSESNEHMSTNNGYMSYEQKVQSKSMGRVGPTVGCDTARAERQAKESSQKAIRMLLDALKKLDFNNKDWIAENKARIVIQQFNNLHQVGLSSKAINNALAAAANETETAVKLSLLCAALLKTTSAP